MADPFGWRFRPSVVDWDGDGLPDLVAVSPEGVICLFRRYRDASTSALKCSAGAPLIFEDGRTITAKRVDPDSYPPSQHRLNTSMFVDVCDWNGNGKWDLIVTCGWHINYLENVGDNAQPRFRDPVPLSTPDGPIRHISRPELPPCVVDWNGDGRLDLLVGGESGFVYFFDRSCLDGKMGTAEVGAVEVKKR